jgi:AcrR family transcriptional regulator
MAERCIILRLEYRIDMIVSRQLAQAAPEPARGARARTRRLMQETATRLMQAGVTPNVSEVAEAAEVSRATAYRYFPSQSALVQAVVDEGLGPILDWRSASTDPERRVADLIGTSMPRIEAFEATFKAALKLSLDQWARQQAGTTDGEPAFVRGHRIALLNDAIAPLEGRLLPKDFTRLAQALSLLFGVEALIVLKDMWGADSAETLGVVQWAAAALVRAAVAEAEGAAGEPAAVARLE